MQLRVLLVEDSEDDAALILRELARTGHSVEHGRVDTTEALVAALEHGEWDVVLADYVLPSFGGLDALGIVRARRPELPFIIVSGVIGEETAVRAMKAGAQDYLTKGQLTRLAPAVEREIKEAAARRVHRQTAAALGASEQRFELFMNTVPAAAWIKDEALRYVFGNRAFLEFIDKKAILDRDDYALWPRAVADRLRANDLLALSTGERVEGVEEVPDGGGVSRILVLLNFPLTDAKGSRFVGGVAVDITERQRTQAELRDAHRRLRLLSERMLEMQEHERRHLARELHDEIGQALTAVKINLQQIAAGIGGSAQSALADSLDVVDCALRQVRNLSLDLRPPHLDDLGLNATLRSQLDRMTKPAGITARFRTSELGGRLHPDLETACYRVFQEALTNVLRHARAASVEVELSLKTGELRLLVKDDGIGFDAQAARQRALQGQSLGIAGMEERVQLAGGCMEIQSCNETGTRVTARFPVRFREDG